MNVSLSARVFSMFVIFAKDPLKHLHRNPKHNETLQCCAICKVSKGARIARELRNAFRSHMAIGKVAQLWQTWMLSNFLNLWRSPEIFWTHPGASELAASSKIATEALSNSFGRSRTSCFETSFWEREKRHIRKSWALTLRAPNEHGPQRNTCFCHFCRPCICKKTWLTLFDILLHLFAFVN